MRRYLPVVVRYLIGAMMVAAGVLKFVKPDFKVADNATLQGFIDSGWLWPLIGVAETVGGIGLLLKRFVPLGLVILAPVVVGIMAFSLKLGGEESSFSVLVLAGCIYLAWQYRARFASLWQTDPEAAQPM
jgi:putative oxidoreductase